MPSPRHRSARPSYHLDGKDPIESVVSPMTISWSMKMESWSGLSILTMLNLRSSLPPTFRSQCLLPKHTALPLGYLPAGLAKPRPPPAAAAPAENAVLPPATAPANQQPAQTAPAESAMPPPATAPANQQPEPAPLRRRSPRLNPTPGHTHAIKSLTAVPPHHSSKPSRMAPT